MDTEATAVEPLVAPGACVGTWAHAAPSRTTVPMGPAPGADRDLCAKRLLLKNQIAFFPLCS